MLTRTFFPRSPLSAGRLAPLPLGAVSAGGSARDHLLSLRAGLLSRSASLWPEAGEQSAFYGGFLPGSIRAPLLLSAMLHIGALLGDNELREEALRRVRLVLDNQREDGSFGGPQADFRARGLMLRALSQAYTLSGDKSILTFMLRYFRFLQEQLRAESLSPDAVLHVSDTLQCGLFLYNLTGKKALLGLMEALCAQSFDFGRFFHTFPYRMAADRMVSPSRLSGAGEGTFEAQVLQTADGELLCEGLRTAALCGMLSGNSKQLSAAERGLAMMRKSHGAPTGAIACDPLLSGTHPSRGIRTLAACQLATSLCTLLEAPDGEHFADDLEMLLYNALPSAFSPDCQQVQSISQANQVRLCRATRFPLSEEADTLFALSDGDSACALLGAEAEILQHQWMLTRDGGLMALGYAPLSLRYRLSEEMVRIHVESAMPVEGSVRIRLELSGDCTFPLHLRIPSWAHGASAAMGGEVRTADPGTVLTLTRQWHDGDEVLLTLPMTVRRQPGYHSAVSVLRGPLLFAAPLSSTETEEGIVCENFGVALLEDRDFVVTVDGEDIRLETAAVRLPEWGLRDGVCDQPPIDLTSSGREEFQLVLSPYAQTLLRLSVLPLL